MDNPSGSTTPAVDPEDLRDQANRIWAHALHEDQDIIQRSNLFLVAESLLFVAYASILSAPAPPNAAVTHGREVALRLVPIFGVALTLLYAYVGHQQWLDLKVIRERAVELLPEYRITRARRRIGRRPSPTMLLTYAVPSLSATIWIILLFTI